MSRFCHSQKVTVSFLLKCHYQLMDLNYLMGFNSLKGSPFNLASVSLSMVLVVIDSFYGTWGGAGECLPLPSTFLAGPEN